MPIFFICECDGQEHEFAAVDGHNLVPIDFDPETVLASIAMGAPSSQCLGFWQTWTEEGWLKALSFLGPSAEREFHEQAGRQLDEAYESAESDEELRFVLILRLQRAMMESTGRYGRSAASEIAEELAQLIDPGKDVQIIEKAAQMEESGSWLYEIQWADYYLAIDGFVIYGPWRLGVEKRIYDPISLTTEVIPMNEYDSEAWGTPFVVESVVSELGIDIPEHPEPMADWMDKGDPRGKFGFYYEYEDGFGRSYRGVTPYGYRFQAADHLEIAEEIVSEFGEDDDFAFLLVVRRDKDHPPVGDEMDDEIWKKWRPLGDDEE